MMQSIWTEGISAPSFARLEKDIHTDVTVIGGGMAGILCTAALKDRGIDCVLLEKETVGSGITAGTTAVLSVQNEFPFRELQQKYGKEKVALYLQASRQAISRYRAMAERFPCDFEEKDAMTYSLHDLHGMKQEAALLRSLGIPAEFTAETPLPFPVAGAVRFRGTAQFHPLKFLYGVAKELPVYEHTEVQKVDGTVLTTPHAVVHAKKVIVATHFPFINRYGWYFLKLYQSKSFVIALKNAPQLDCTIMDEAENGIYMRNSDDLLLIGGGDRRTGKQGNDTETVREFAKRYFPAASEVKAWSNQDCVTPDGFPMIGRYRSGKTDLLVASGFGGWGMTGSMIAADLLADLAIGKGNRYATVFAPDRKLPFLPLLQNGGHALAGLLTPKAPRCSHMGCALHWNADEGVWECPCHGSCYNGDGQLLTNPAKKSLKSKRAK